MSRIFISYRRDDVDAEAGRIADRLIDHFGEDAVFHDRQSLNDGERWRDRIDSELASCEVMLVVIGPQWETLTLADGTRRLHAQDDIACYEVASALQRGIRVIPLLVRRDSLPAAADLPPALLPLLGAQARRLHEDAFAPLLASLIDGIEGRGVRRRRRWLWAAGAVAMAAILFGGLLQLLRPGPEATATATPPAQPALPTQPTPPTPGPVARNGDLHLRLQLPPNRTAADDELRFLMKQNRPPSNLKLLLDPPLLPNARPVEFVLRGIALPLPQEEYEADIVPQPQSAFKGTPTRATVCLTRTDAPPQPGSLRAIVECPANDRCRAADENPGPFVICGTPQSPPTTRQTRSGWPWLSTAHAQYPVARPPSSPPPSSAPPREAIWIIPSLETLHRRHAAGKESAFTEISLTSPPLTGQGVDDARQVSVQITANGRLAWIDGLPPDASAVPFDAAKGVDLRFGLENLGFSGARQGRESIALTLRFLAGTKVVRETSAVIDYIALRPQPKPASIGEPALGLRWTAQYFAGRKDDRWQVFLAGADSIKGLERAKQQFDALNLQAQLDGAGYPLVAVIRPPWERPVWGLNVGLVLPTGQIRFTFDDASSVALCGRLRHLAGQPRSIVRRDTYRRTVDDTEVTEWCSNQPPRPA